MRWRGGEHTPLHCSRCSSAVWLVNELRRFDQVAKEDAQEADCDRRLCTLRDVFNSLEPLP